MNIAINRQSEDLFAPYFFALRTLLALWTGIGLMLFATVTARCGATKREAPKSAR